MQIKDFQKNVWDYYRAHKRGMPWRTEPTPYYVLVSEVMLQQTQVPRVLPKFAGFVARFPDIAALATAPLSDVLSVWSGLGYNRRAKFLWQASQKIQQQFRGELPRDMAGLTSLPGIGPSTAGAIMVYAYNLPVVFIETNIRTVFIHHFFANQANTVTDAQLRDIVVKTLPGGEPREWFWALMDYGAHLKATVGAGLERVHGYRHQSAFKGSRRQIRGQVLRMLLGSPHTSRQLAALITDKRLSEVLIALSNESLIKKTGDVWHLT